MHKMLAYWEVQNCQSLNSWHLLTLLKKKKRITSHFSLIYLKCVHVNGGPSIDLYSFQLVIGPHGSWNQEGWFEMQMSRQWSTPPPFSLCCICQGEKWLVQGSVTHTHLITFLGPTELSQAVVDAGAVPLLVLCIQEPEIALKRIAVSALSDIAKHSPELAQTVVDAGVIAHLAQMILNPDAKLKVF